MSSLPTLSRTLFPALPSPGPIKVLQFGEGVFLRAFTLPLLQTLINQGQFAGSVVICPPRSGHALPAFRAQDHLYTLLTRGLEGGQTVNRHELISAISDTVDPQTELTSKLLPLAREPGLRFVFSNTTEAGIAFAASDTPASPSTFPAKLTLVLLERFNHFKGDSSKGLIVLPCELLPANGQKLLAIVQQYAAAWNLPAAFNAWLTSANFFCDTLVDRIVPGYPKSDAAEIEARLGYRDQLLDAAEPFLFFAIQPPRGLSREQLQAELPLHRAHPGVLFTDDITAYQTRKVRILNGAHTMTVPAAYLAGKDTVRECIDDAAISDYIRKGLAEEIIPTLDLPKADLESFAAATLERFGNPFIRHELLSIALNSTSKFKARVLPSILEYQKRKGTLPVRLTFSLAALIAFYRSSELKDGALVGHRAQPANTYPIKDDAKALGVLKDAWALADQTPGSIRKVVQTVLGSDVLWGQDLNQVSGLTDAVAKHLASIVERGSARAMQAL